MSNKGCFTQNIMLQDNGQLYSNKQDVAEILNSYYSTIADDIGSGGHIYDETFDNILLRQYFYFLSFGVKLCTS
jgi:hypothetical protein